MRKGEEGMSKAQETVWTIIVSHSPWPLRGDTTYRDTRPAKPPQMADSVGVKPSCMFMVACKEEEEEK